MCVCVYVCVGVCVEHANKFLQYCVHSRFKHKTTVLNFIVFYSIK